MGRLFFRWKIESQSEHDLLFSATRIFKSKGTFLRSKWHCFLIYSGSRSLLEYRAALSVFQRAVRAAETSRKENIQRLLVEFLI